MQKKCHESHVLIALLKILPIIIKNHGKYKIDLLTWFRVCAKLQS